MFFLLGVQSFKTTSVAAKMTSTYTYIIPITQTSCVLSMLGSILITISWAYPEENREKHARILLLWLSVSDFLSSFIYFVQTFYPDIDGKSKACQTFAVLGILFPVASFVWTNLIAFYLYSVIVNRFAFHKHDFKKCFLKSSHALSWGLGILCGLIVFGFGHAGRNDDNTGGWCWIYTKNNNPAHTIGWEIIGGKLVEWLSCFIILPYFYYSAAVELSKFDTSTNLKYEASSSRYQTPKDSPSSLSSNRNISVDSVDSKSSELANQRHSLSRNNSEDCTGTTKQSRTSNSTLLNPLHTTGNMQPQAAVNNKDSAIVIISDSDNSVKRTVSDNESVSHRKPVRFNKFYLKMAVLPIVFFFIRFWGSCRILINAVSTPSHQTNEAFGILQAFFDPSQGFFNALIFILGSEDGYRHTLISLSHFIQVFLFWCPGATSIATIISNKARKISEQQLSANGINSINNPATSSEATTKYEYRTNTQGRSLFQSESEIDNRDSIGGSDYDANFSDNW
jgi:hypothetical protein